MIGTDRGTGRTTEQMQSAPLNAVFVWCNGDLAYPKMIADKIDRRDLKIVSPMWLRDNRWRGLRCGGIIVDHAENLSIAEYESLYEARIYFAAHQPKETSNDKM